MGLFGLGQTSHAAPLVPQAVLEVPTWQLVPSQQPVTQLADAASHLQIPPLQMGVVAGHVGQGGGDGGDGGEPGGGGGPPGGGGGTVPTAQPLIPMQRPL